MTRPLSFQQACDFLFPRTSGVAGRAWSLEPTQRLLASVGHPESHFPAVHIGGTNGKGSVAAMVAEVCRAAGIRVGLFTSPHLVDVRERFVVDGAPIAREAFASWTEALRPAIDATEASFFEITTAIAFADFAARHVDLAVVEVGLGGRLDSTNVLTPLVSAVTNIGLEHTEFLGNTLEAIAEEKAGIAKPGVPFIVGEPDAGVARVLARAGHARGGVVRMVEPAARYDGPVGLPGAHQRRNAVVARDVLAALPDDFRVPESVVAEALGRVRLPGRLQRRGRWLFDVAHNPMGLETLVAHVGRHPPAAPVHALFGVQADKDGRRMLERLREVCGRVWVTSPPTVPTERRADLGAMVGPARPEVTIQPDFDAALAAVQVGAGTVIVTGSFHTVGDAMARLPGFPPLG